MYCDRAAQQWAGGLRGASCVLCGVCFFCLLASLTCNKPRKCPTLDVGAEVVDVAGCGYWIMLFMIVYGFMSFFFVCQGGGGVLAAARMDVAGKLCGFK